VGECDLGTQTCQADGSWGVCLNSLGQKVLVPGEMDELCDLKDNDCDGQTDEGNPEGGTECGVDQGVCSVGIRVCENGQIQCKNGVLPTQEVCNNLDDDCDGVTDEDVTGDKYETNETCDNPGLLPNVTDNDDPTIITELSIFPKNDKDWFRTTFTESGALDWCVLEPQCYKLNLRMYPPISADPTQWEVCLHLGGADSADCGTFETKNTFCSRYPEDFVEDGQGDFFAFSILFEGKCGLPDNRVGTIVVRSADVQDPIETCEPYRLWLSKEYLGAKECSDF
jgi:hypothetical protein